MRTFLQLVISTILVLAPACSSSQRHSALECDKAAALELAPQLEAAIAAKDKAALTKLAVELGADAFVCGLRSLVEQAGSGSGSEGR